ncbi:zinc transporter ZupT [Myxococcota bacterium]|nr:zinc transporter ZupT [Myxococcota bacterium]MBU1535131.1 zinc transporter ZupT [Myxococcota bacterium]
MSTQNILFAFGLTLFAGLSTGIGSAMAFFAKKTSTRFLTVSLGFSAGVMLYVSFIDIFPKAREAIALTKSPSMATLYTTLAFFAGMLLIGLIDKLVPNFENPHELHDPQEMYSTEAQQKSKEHSLMRMGIFSAIAIAIHNFPEGMATFMAALQNPKVGVSIAIAIAIHNIPEGIAVSVPIFYATGSRKKAFVLSFLSGLSEPLGALIGFFILRTFMSNMVFGVIFSAVAGIMVFISLDELLPTAEKYGEHHLAIYGVMSGMAVMAVSLVLLGG